MSNDKRLISPYHKGKTSNSICSLSFSLHRLTSAGAEETLPREGQHLSSVNTLPSVLLLSRGDVVSDCSLLAVELNTSHFKVLFSPPLVEHDCCDTLLHLSLLTTENNKECLMCNCVPAKDLDSQG